MVWGTGKGLADALIAALRGHRNAARLTLRFNQRVERLTMEGGRVDGAAGVDEKTGVPFEVQAEQVVVAAGGINGGDSAECAHTGIATGAGRRRPCSPARTVLPTANSTTLLLLLAVF